MTERRIAQDDHRTTIEHFLSLLVQSGELGTVVHVGAHAGEEVDASRAHGARRIVLVEANPASCELLEKRFSDTPDVDVVHAAAAEHNGVARLMLHANARGETESASLLPMKELARLVPTLKTQETVDVPACTLNTLLERARVEPAAIGLLVLDVQGAELQVLHGAGSALESIRAVLTEVALIDLYAGAAREDEVVRAMQDAGFRPVDALYYELYEGDRRFPAWGDVLFLRMTAAALS
jgi:FkbM family methyltransferase